MTDFERKTLKQIRSEIGTWKGRKYTNFDRERIGNKLAIVGCADTTKNNVKKLYRQKGWEIWGINTLWKSTPHIIPKATRWFMVHKYDRAINEKGDFDQWEWMKQVKDFPIYAVGEDEKFKEVPMATPFPRELTHLFRNYFTNSISYMIALAIYEGFSEINLYGVEMALSGEYGYQRPSVEYFLGIAEGLGIKVYLPERCDLLTTTVLYGYEDHNRMAEKLRQQTMEFTRRTQELNGNIQKLAADRNACFGALQMIDKWKLDKEKLTQPTPIELEQRIKDCQAQEQQLLQQTFVLKGGQEMVDYMERCWLQEPKTGGQ